jgi:outer membrane protein OmpA-like peptidoglycan-associated protein
MNRARWSALFVALLAAGVTSACGLLQVRTPERPGQTLTVLLPDGDGENSGRATVSNPAGATALVAPNDATVASTNKRPTRARRLSDSEVQRIFGEALSALPPPPQRFTLYFRFESDELTEDSRSMVPDVLQAIKNHPVPELLVVGHTDTTGTTTANFDLGRKRAEMVRGALIDAGLEGSAIKITSHGETDLLVPTADDTFEPRNRRVDISVR